MYFWRKNNKIFSSILFSLLLLLVRCSHKVQLYFHAMTHNMGRRRICVWQFTQFWPENMKPLLSYARIDSRQSFELKAVGPNRLLFARIEQFSSRIFISPKWELFSTFEMCLPWIFNVGTSLRIRCSPNVWIIFYFVPTRFGGARLTGMRRIFDRNIHTQNRWQQNITSTLERKSLSIVICCYVNRLFILRIFN